MTAGAGAHSSAPFPQGRPPRPAPESAFPFPAISEKAGKIARCRPIPVALRCEISIVSAKNFMRGRNERNRSVSGKQFALIREGTGGGRAGTGKIAEPFAMLRTHAIHANWPCDERPDR